MIPYKFMVEAFEAADRSKVKHRANEGWNYYLGKHEIEQYRAFYYNADGVLVEDKHRSNIKIGHPFFTELVDQQVQYMLSNKERIALSDTPELQAVLDTYFNDEMKAALSELLTGVVAKGWEYLYAYVDERGALCFTAVDGRQVVHIPAERTPDHQERIMYRYRRDDGGEGYFLQLWTAEDVTFYQWEEDEGKTVITKDGRYYINPRPHILLTERGRSKGASFGRVPFFRLDNSEGSVGNLTPIKHLIDDYDLMSCGLSNNIQDSAEVIFFVSGFQGSNLDELQQSLKTKKILGLAPDGGVDIKTLDIPYQARQTKLELDEKNIYRFGMGFNAAQVGDGNVTNVVIKSRYALLDLKCNKLEIRLRAFLKEVLAFVLDQHNEEYGTGYKPEDAYFDFTREILTNAQDNAQIGLVDAQTEQARVNTLLALGDILPSSEVFRLVCEVLDVDYEDVKDKMIDDLEGAYEQTAARGSTGTAAEGEAPVKGAQAGVQGFTEGDQQEN